MIKLSYESYKSIAYMLESVQPFCVKTVFQSNRIKLILMICVPVVLNYQINEKGNKTANTALQMNAPSIK